MRIICFPAAMKAFRMSGDIPDQGQVMLRYDGHYANAHGGKVGKASLIPVALGMIEEDVPPIPPKGWAEMIRKVYEVDLPQRPRCRLSSS